MGREKRLILLPGGPSETFTEHISYEENNKNHETKDLEHFLQLLRSRPLD